MTRRKMLSLLARRERLLEEQEACNAAVRSASDGRFHHQACPIGGLRTGMPAEVSGDDCWCGATAEARARRDGENSATHKKEHPQYACPRCDRAGYVRIDGGSARCTWCGWTGSSEAAALAADELAS